MNGNGLTFSYELESQLDTASGISLIKSKYVPPILIHNISENGYEGINGSRLEIFGQVEARISIDDRRADGMKLRVPDQAMKCNVILERDSIRILDLGLVRVNEKPIEENFTDEILNIEIGLFEDSEVDKLKINCRLSNEIRGKLVERLQESYLRAEKPSEPEVRAELKLYVKDKQPFHFASGRLSQDEKNKLREIVDDLLTRRIIRPGNSEYASRTVLVKKKNGKVRLCIDYRVLNKITAKDNYPLPIIEEQIDALYGKRCFSLLDLKDGFHHVYMSEDSIKYTAFVTPFGQYEYLKMPFGLKNAPARFQRYVNDILSDLIKSGNVIVYMDDFLIATDTIERHFKTLDKVFHLLAQNLLELRLDKCRFLYDEIEFLGYIVSEKGIRPSDHGIVAVKSFPIPKCIRDVQSFLGLCSYFRKFIENFSLIAGPLYNPI